MRVSEWQTFFVRVVPGHRVASGLNQDPRFPGGTLRMQWPHFLERGLDLARFYPGTMNVSLAPRRYCVQTPRYTFRAVRWHPVAPAEDFSFLDVRALRKGRDPVEGFIYYPHPETKPEHFQKDDILELLLPFLDNVPYGTLLQLEVPREQLRVE